MIELRWLGEFDKRLQYRYRMGTKYDNSDPRITPIWTPWVDVQTVPADSDKLPDTD